MEPVAFLSRLSTLLVDKIVDEVNMLRGVPDEIEKLQRNFRRLSKYLADAERRKVEDEAVRDWLKELKDIFYDVDDILDQCLIEAEKSRTSSSSAQPSSPVSSCFYYLFCRCCCDCNVLFTHEIGTRIKSLNERLEDVIKVRSNFDLKITTTHSSSFSNSLVNTTHVVESDIVGRQIHEDTKKLVRLLTAGQVRDSSSPPVVVYAIVGTGGIGKTTLAQKIFNEESIERVFRDLRIWVSVSREFNDVDVLRAIIISFPGGDVSALGDAPGRAVLAGRVESMVKDKKVLLVLDDVWAAEVLWDVLLRNILKVCAAGSRVLVTTRNEEVAMRMKAADLHRVGLLSTEDGWLLLCKKAHGGGEEDPEMQFLKETGMKIVERCDGLPLAIKAVGGMLCTQERSKRAWEEVLRNPVWSMTTVLPEEVNTALYLSYLDLPSHMKQCFLYCSLFPQGTILGRQELITYWIAEGFVEDQDGASTMEELAEGYHRELVRRNLLQPIDPEEYYKGQQHKVHDLLRSLALFLSQDESLSTRAAPPSGSGSTSAPMKLRRLAIVDKNIDRVSEYIRDKSALRTLMLDWNQIRDVNGLFDYIPRMRVLSLRRTLVTELPAALADLVHLRMLDLSRTPLTAIPESIRNLRNLQILNLNACTSLTSLPEGIVHLHSLRTLDIYLAPVESIPVGLGSLLHLRRLRGFRLPAGGSGCTLEELGPLSHLRILTVGNMERASRGLAALENKSHLTYLQLYWWRADSESEAADVNYDDSEDTVIRIEQDLQQLRLPPYLEKLFINGYSGRVFPLSISSFSTLKSLELRNCLCCLQLPTLGQLPCLENLLILNASSVTRIGPEFLRVGGGEQGPEPGGSNSFLRLMSLYFHSMKKWEEWEWSPTERAMPRLKELRIKNCPELSSLPVGLSDHATALTKMEIVGTMSLRAVGSLPSLEELIVKNNPGLCSISGLPALRKLRVEECPSLQTVVQVNTTLRNLHLSDKGMESLPDWLSSVGSEEIEIRCSEGLASKILMLSPQDPERSKIQHIPRVVVYDNDGVYRGSYNN